ncbi:zinc finger and BTB domain-containing protein 24 isoform X2 [Lingula anatina]|nr:zinc finger and BTB domain-containing protein 24 isoform X2 [Lingula anatina]|eukprot:XP_013396621.1 zinc finger and BTB domain-containing protein 24 isoform X2 [Lingula anatina]
MATTDVASGTHDSLPDTMVEETEVAAIETLARTAAERIQEEEAEALLNTAAEMRRISEVEFGEITQQNSGVQKREMSSVAVQANDYEIERRSGKVPSRRRLVPAKFRDYRNTENPDEDDEEDEDYTPERERILVKSGKRGRPRKHPIFTVENGESAEGELNVTQNPSKRPRGRPRGSTQSSNVNQPFECETCGKRFSQKGNLNTHKNTHTGLRLFVCQVEGCGKSYVNKEGLRMHSMMIHLGISPFKCTVCERMFSSNTALQEHTRLHKGIKPLKCEICNRSFRQVSCLRRHLVTHSSETPYSCEICGKKFSQPQYVRSHKKVHTGEKPFICETCGRGFAHKSDLTRHNIIHTGEKPYACEECGARFSDSSSRRRHVKEHTGSKPYKCHLCSELFKRAGQLKAHLSRKHAAEKPLKITRGPNNSLQLTFPDSNRTATGLGEVIALVDSRSLDHQRKIVRHLQGPGTAASVGHVTSETTSDEFPGQVVQFVDGTTVQLSNTESSSGQVIQAEQADSQHQHAVDFIDIVKTLAEQVNHTGPQEFLLIQSEDGTPMLVRGMESAETENVISSEGTSSEKQDREPELKEANVGGGDPEASINTSTVETPIEEPEHQEQIEQQSDPNQDQQVAGEIKQQTSVVDENNVEEGSEQNTCQEQLQQQEPEQSEAATSTVDFVNNPNFDSQEYYNWLANFTELCKLVPMPLDVDMFQKISQVQKTISDVLAMPTGVLSQKENFRILMNISKDLNSIVNEHLGFILSNLNENEGQ